ncbi:hypothetical protein ACOSQ3_014593 [Xanthoceras sorbifolium]
MTNVCGFNEVVLDGGASCRLLADDVRIVGEGASGLNQGIILSDKVLGPMIVKVAQDVDRNMKLKRSSWKHLARANGQDIGQANNNMALGKRVVLTNLASVGSAQFHFANKLIAPKAVMARSSAKWSALCSNFFYINTDAGLDFQNGVTSLRIVDRDHTGPTQSGKDFDKVWPIFFNCYFFVFVHHSSSSHGCRWSSRRFSSSSSSHGRHSSSAACLPLTRLYQMLSLWLICVEFVFSKLPRLAPLIPLNFITL